ncbi:anti-sigma factor [Streptomyces fuscigenes]|uniref:anti-sigma factor n=1 Tax=Streptomyces fuscigenes TaxID=1528880 RepID=UPI001F41109E|nr:anti-sigma factor [Streptomyces fuscigenes]MCF3960201.1 anti-sigma factor [Streptomyces fuscigenes]
MNEVDPHLDVGAYVLHALPPEEEAAFENHLASCPQCRREVEDLTGRAVQLGTAVESQTPPPELRSRVLQQITEVRQDHVVSEERRDRSAASVMRRHRFRQRVFKLALAPSVAAAVALGGVASWQHTLAEDAQGQVAEAHAKTDALTGVLAAPDATISTAKLADGAHASVVASRTHGQAAFIASNLPQLTGHQVYELWYSKAGQFRPAGLLPGAGHQAQVLQGQLKGATAVGITVEPTGGSPQPTSDPLSILKVPA